MITPCPDHFMPRKENQYPLYRRLGWPEGQSKQVRKISPPPTRIRFPDLPAHREPLFTIITQRPDVYHLPCMCPVRINKNQNTGLDIRAYVTLFLNIPCNSLICWDRCKQNIWSAHSMDKLKGNFSILQKVCLSTLHN